MKNIGSIDFVKLDEININLVKLIMSFTNFIIEKKDLIIL